MIGVVVRSTTQRRDGGREARRLRQRCNAAEAPSLGLVGEILCINSEIIWFGIVGKADCSDCLLFIHERPADSVHAIHNSAVCRKNIETGMIGARHGVAFTAAGSDREGLERSRFTMLSNIADHATIYSSKSATSANDNSSAKS